MPDLAALAGSFMLGALFSGILCLVVLWKKKPGPERMRAFKRMIGPLIGFTIGSFIAGGWEQGLISGLGFCFPLLLCVFLERLPVQEPSE